MSRYLRWILAPCLVIAAGSCNHGVESTTQMQHEKMDQMHLAAGEYFVHMADNAILRDMSLVDFHFVGATTELSGTGVARLERMTPLLNTYGGLIRYETYCKNDELVAKRIEHVREYLALVGCDMERVQVERMISGGQGIAAVDAIEIKEKGTAPPTSGAPMGGLTLGMGQGGGSSTQ